MLVGGSASAQKRGSVWCFGDSALVDFSDTANIVTGTSSVKSRGSCVSISDSAGYLILYAYSRAGVNHNTTLLKNNQIFYDRQTSTKLTEIELTPTNKSRNFTKVLVYVEQVQQMITSTKVVINLMYNIISDLI